jgi:hypothetical protein
VHGTLHEGKSALIKRKGILKARSVAELAAKIGKCIRLLEDELPLSLSVEGSHKSRGFAILRSGFDVGKLQVIDSGFVGQEFRFTSAGLLPQTASDRPTPVQSASCLVQIAKVN